MVLFGFTDLLYHKFKVAVQHTRKIAHICTGFIALTFPLYLDEIWHVAILSTSFLGLMALSEKFQWFKSITAVKRKSYGSWLFALVVLICFAVFKRIGPIFYYLPILILTLADPAAAIFGRKFNYKPLTIFGQKKTIGGSIAFFLVAVATQLAYISFARFLVTADFQIDFSDILKFCIVALASAVAEFFSTKGWDNLTIPLTVLAVLLLL
ncbi:MAG: phosphatidate cytidylyltransferase [Bacteroidetes bacterium]|nr:MAG: phosphatidate cytidylyltransferase [Bacteroidota bacterium]